MEGARRRKIMACCCPFFCSFSFACSLVSLPTSLMLVSSCSSCCFCPRNSSYLRVALSVQQVSLPLPHVFVLLAAFPFRFSLQHILQNTCRSFCFVFFFFFFFLLFSWSGLSCCVLVPGRNLLDLDELRLFHFHRT